jgi:hypothetical protein
MSNLEVKPGRGLTVGVASCDGSAEVGNIPGTNLPSVVQLGLHLASLGLTMPRILGQPDATTPPKSVGLGMHISADLLG